MAACLRSHFATVYVTRGPSALQTWIAGLIDSDIALTKQSNSFSGPSHSSPSPLTSLASSVIVNAYASKRRVLIINLSGLFDVSVSASVFIVAGKFSLDLLIVDNVEKGVGVAKSKKVAKEEAARQTLVKMGW